MDLGFLRPGASRTVSLDVGRHQVTLTPTTRYAVAKTEIVRISPRDREFLTIRPSVANLRVKNPYRFAVQLEVDGQRIGTIAPGATVTVTGLDRGRVNVELVRGREVVSQQNLRLTRRTNAWQPTRFAVVTPSFQIAFR